jgi:hypothetical membrane protein
MEVRNGAIVGGQNSHVAFGAPGRARLGENHYSGRTIPGPLSGTRSRPKSASSPRRSIVLGASLWVVAPVLLVLGMAITQLGWTTPYSLLDNVISDLGAVNCGPWPTSHSHYVCSPWHVVFDTSAVLFGLLAIAGALLIRRALPPGRLATVGLFLVVVAGIGAIGVGLFPEDVNPSVHAISALLAFLLGNVAVTLLGVSMIRQSPWRGYVVFSELCGAEGLAALVWYASGDWGTIGQGGTERLIVAPLLLWITVIGIRAGRARTSEVTAQVEPSADTECRVDRRV